MRLLPLTLISLFIPVAASACDICALYTSSSLEGHAKGKYTLAISEQYTSYDRAESLEENSLKDAELVRGYSTTQFAFAYDVTDSFGMQLNLPVIGRRFDTIDNYRADTDNDMGIGDMSLLGTYSVLNKQEAEWSALANVNIGIKLPTGDTGVLKDVSELEEGEESGSEHAILKHHTTSGISGAGGRVLTFGSGSYDYIFGANTLLRYQKLLFIAQSQYTLRTEGDYNYEFADDFIFTAGPGYFFMLGHEYTLAGRLALTGEFKGKDNFNGEILQGSQVSNIYLGPEVLYVFDSKISGVIGMDFRTTGEDLNATVVPEWRMRFSLAYRFS